MNGHIRVICYNVLAPSLVDPSHFPGTPKFVLNTYAREMNITREIEFWNADVVCLQEVDESSYKNHYKSAMENLGYSIMIYKKRTGQKKDGCALFARDSKLKLWRMDSIEVFAEYL